jgi:aryl-alcohol dehydrogenase-like predicted oxidoreductase
VVSSGASALDAATGMASTGTGRTVKFHDGTIVPALGQGSWHLGQGKHPAAVEEEAMRTSLSLGMTLIDTAEIYGNGSAERFIGHVIAGQRERAFLVSKVWPWPPATYRGRLTLIPRDDSLARRAPMSEIAGKANNICVARGFCRSG